MEEKEWLIYGREGMAYLWKRRNGLFIEKKE